MTKEELKAHQKEWYQRNKERLLELAKARNQRPEFKAYRKACRQRPEVKERTREYEQRPEFKAYQKEYRNRLEVKERRKERSRERRKSEILFQVMRLMQSQSEQND